MLQESEIVADSSGEEIEENEAKVKKYQQRRDRVLCMVVQLNGGERRVANPSSKNLYSNVYTASHRKVIVGVSFGKKMEYLF